MTTWREVERDARARLAAAGLDDPIGDARRIVERASGYDGAEAVLHHDEHPNIGQRTSVGEMVDRRCAGEPLQYVVGRWGFRTLDLFVDRRVLIPRPETEVVAGAALEALDAAPPSPAVVVDLGTGSGAIALAIAAERGPAVEVWATDRSSDAIAVARANLAGLGRRAGVVRLVEGDWYAALPEELRGRVDVVVSNPPYVATSDELPPEVRDWEPLDALLAGPRGLDAIEVIVNGATAWLRDGGALVVEIGERHGAAAIELARAAGFATAEVRPDLSGRDRLLVASVRA